MKKLFSLLICLSLLCSFCAPAYAISKTYALNVNGLSMTIDIPDHYVVYTDGLEIDKERAKEFGEFGEMLLQEDTTSMVLEAWDENTRTEIAVTCMDSKLGDYNELSDTVLLGLGSAFESVTKQMGGEVSSVAVFQGAQAKFLKYASKMPHDSGSDGFDHIIQYNTAYGNKTVNITLHSYNDEPTDQIAAEMEQVVLSVRFGANPASAPEAEQSPSFVYNDKERGVSFTVPANWKEEPLNEDREVLKAKFASTEEQGLSIMYGWLDFYPLVEELGLSADYPRETVNQDFFTVQDMNSFLKFASESAGEGNEASDVTAVSYGGNDYFKGIMKGNATLYGLNMSASMITLYHFDKGYLYQLQFFGSEDSAYYDDFIQLVSSVKYAAEEPQISLFGNSTLPAEAASPVLPSVPWMPENLEFDMTPDQVHALFGRPDESDSEYAELTDYYQGNYDYRPRNFDPSGAWRDSMTSNCLFVDYENRPSGLGVNGFAFLAVYDTPSEDILDMFREFMGQVTDYYGIQPELANPEESYFQYTWNDTETMAVFTIVFQDEIRTYFSFYDTEYVSVE